jgi:hypothetical protein
MSEEDRRAPSPGPDAPAVSEALPERASPYPISRLAPPFSIVETARAIEAADAALGLRLGGQLDVIADQIRGLQDKARALLEKARRDQELHRARCNLQRRAGGIYHLYRGTDGERYWSMLSPSDWGGRPPHSYEGSYRLELDMSWTALDDV